MTDRPTGPAYTYRAVALTVHDGDTFLADVDLGGRVHAHWDLRLMGVNAPELKTGRPGTDARDALYSLLVNEPMILGRTSPVGEPVPLLVRTQKTRGGEDVKSFSRYVAEVWVERSTDDWIDVGQAMVDSGHAVWEF